MKKIGFVGLGKLGMPCAEAFATKFETSGYDVAPVTSDTVAVKDSIKDVEESRRSFYCCAYPT